MIRATCPSGDIGSSRMHSRSPGLSVAGTRLPGGSGGTAAVTAVTSRLAVRNGISPRIAPSANTTSADTATRLGIEPHSGDPERAELQEQAAADQHTGGDLLPGRPPQ